MDKLPEKYIMKISGSVLEYENDLRYYNKKIKKRIFKNCNGCIVPVCYNYMHGEIGCLLGLAELKEDETGISADCYIIDTLFTRRIIEYIKAPYNNLGALIVGVESVTHGDETIITKGEIREISIIPGSEKFKKYYIEVTDNEQNTGAT